jgi:hypothetical protein
MSGMSKESAIRILKEFKDEGIVEIEGNNFHILNRDNLYKISHTGSGRRRIADCGLRNSDCLSVTGFVRVTSGFWSVVSGFWILTSDFRLPTSDF